MENGQDYEEYEIRRLREKVRIQADLLDKLLGEKKARSIDELKRLLEDTWDDE